MYPLGLRAALLAWSGLVCGAAVEKGSVRAQSARGLAVGADASGCLATDALQTASSLTGQEAGNSGIKAGQSPSEM